MLGQCAEQYQLSGFVEIGGMGVEETAVFPFSIFLLCVIINSPNNDFESHAEQVDSSGWRTGEANEPVNSKQCTVNRKAMGFTVHCTLDTVH